MTIGSKQPVLWHANSGPHTTPAIGGDFFQAWANHYVDSAAVWRKLRRRKWTVAGVSAAFLLLLVPGIFLLPRWYTAETEIMIDPRGHGVDVAAVLTRLPTDSETVLTEVEALRSRSLAEKTIQQLGLLSNPEFNPALSKDSWSPMAMLGQILNRIEDGIGSALTELTGKPQRSRAKTDPMTEATDIILKHLQVVPVGRAQVIKATYTSKNPEVAASVMNTLASLYIESEIDHRLSIAEKVHEFLNAELSGMRSDVEKSDKAIEAYREQAGLIQGIVQGHDALLTTQEISEVNDELIAATSKRQEAESRLKVIGNRGDAAAEALQNPLIHSLEEQEATLRETKAELTATHGNRYPKLLSIEASIADLEQKKHAEVAKIVASLRNDLAMQTQREVALQERLNELTAKAQVAGQAQAHLALLEREAEPGRKLLDAFLTQFQQLTSEQALHVADAYVISKADIPSRPSFPNVLLFAALGLVASVSVGVGTGLAFERDKEGVRSADDIQTDLKARSLGLVPEVRSPSKIPAHVLNRPQSVYTESIRNLLSTLTLFERHQVVLVTSAEPGEGKSSIAAALARLAASAGQKTILVDCDLRRPAIREMLELNGASGLLQLLAGDVGLHEVVCRDSMTDAHTIVSGGVNPAAPTLFGDRRMKDLIETLRRSYDLIILDSPPASSLSDARVLATLADRVVFVVRWEKTKRRVVQAALTRLEECGTEVTGVVVNQVNLKRHARFGYSDSSWYRSDRAYYVD